MSGEEEAAATPRETIYKTIVSKEHFTISTINAIIKLSTALHAARASITWPIEDGREDTPIYIDLLRAQSFSKKRSHTCSHCNPPATPRYNGRRRWARTTPSSASHRSVAPRSQKAFARRERCSTGDPGCVRGYKGVQLYDVTAKRINCSLCLTPRVSFHSLTALYVCGLHFKLAYWVQWQMWLWVWYLFNQYWPVFQGRGHFLPTCTLAVLHHN